MLNVLEGFSGESLAIWVRPRFSSTDVIAVLTDFVVAVVSLHSVNSGRGCFATPSPGRIGETEVKRSLGTENNQDEAPT